MKKIILIILAIFMLGIVLFLTIGENGILFFLIITTLVIAYAYFDDVKKEKNKIKFKRDR